MSKRYTINKTKAALAKGETIYVPEINRVFDPVVVELIAQAGFTCTWIDMEHTHLDLERLSTMKLRARSISMSSCAFHTDPTTKS